MTVLQERPLRRRPNRPPSTRRRSRGRHRARRRAAVGIAALVVAAAALLVFKPSQAAGPATVGFHKPAILTRAHPARPNPPARGSYGMAPAPPAERVQVKLRLPLRSGLLFDVNTGQVLWDRDPSAVLPIASLTKMMTALVVVAHARPDDQVQITPDALHYQGSGVGLLPKNKRVPLLALLYGLLLPSGNDAAIALADDVAGTQSRFIALMNQRARELGLSCTHFTTVSGIVDQGNHSCAQDLALIAHKLLEEPLLASIVASRSAILPFPIKGGKLFLYNNNPLLELGYPGTDGVKTGYTQASGPCLVATARRGRTWLGVVLLHSGDPSLQAPKLLDAGFAKLAQS
jgi:serine-type D-Ala-D-Ala carboxypeptidase (penicillin-binding protein 5/6)